MGRGRGGGVRECLLVACAGVGRDKAPIEGAFGFRLKGDLSCSAAAMYYAAQVPGVPAML
jgi:hypothetical protein